MEINQEKLRNFCKCDFFQQFSVFQQSMIVMKTLIKLEWIFFRKKSCGLISDFLNVHFNSLDQKKESFQ